jgi:alpha-galactosidase
LLLGCDLEKLDDFTLNLLENDEVIAVNQDSLGRQAVSVAKSDDTQVFAKKLADGSTAVGLFNLGSNAPVAITARWSNLKLAGKQSVRDLWRQKELGPFDGQFQITVAPHGAEMVRMQKAGL